MLAQAVRSKEQSIRNGVMFVDEKWGVQYAAPAWRLRLFANAFAVGRLPSRTMRCWKGSMKASPWATWSEQSRQAGLLNDILSDEGAWCSPDVLMGFRSMLW